MSDLVSAAQAARDGRFRFWNARRMRYVAGAEKALGDLLASIEAHRPVIPTSTLAAADALASAILQHRPARRRVIMSSTYRIICASHDPALVLCSPDTTRPEEAIAALAAGVDGHPHCDLIIGRYSYPLIEVCCTAHRSNGIHHGSSHGTDEWVDASWLRLLALSEQGAADRAELRSCWSRDMAWRLRHELGIEATDQHDGSAP